MGSTDTLCLRWNEFETNIKHGFSELRSNEDFFDVTLSCGSRQIKAHRVILSACSSFFRSLLKSIPHDHPFLYLRGIDVKHLESLLCFMYNGEVRIDQDELNPFLLVAQELKVNGLIQESPGRLKRRSAPKEEDEAPKKEDEMEEVNPLVVNSSPEPSASKDDVVIDDDDMKEEEGGAINTSPSITISKLFPLRQNDEGEGDKGSDSETMHLGESSSGLELPFVTLDTDTLEDNLEDYDEEYDLNEPEFFTKSDESPGPVIDAQNSIRTNELLDAELLKCVSERDANNLFRCLKCSHTSRFKRDVKRHVEAKHLTTCFRCSKCFRIFKTRRSLSKHEMRMHRRPRFIISSS